MDSEIVQLVIGAVAAIVTWIIARYFSSLEGQMKAKVIGGFAVGIYLIIKYLFKDDALAKSIALGVFASGTVNGILKASKASGDDSTPNGGPMIMGIMFLIMILGAVMLCGCSTLKIDRQYSETGITSEKISTYGILENRAQNINFHKASDNGKSTDNLSTDMTESAEPAVTITQTLFNDLLTAAMKGATTK